MTTDADLAELLAKAGFKPSRGATREDIARVEKLFGIELPDEFFRLWLYSDGLTSDGIDIASLPEIEKYAGIFPGGFDCVPFTDSNDSNPYAICCREPLRGFVVHIYHDDEPDLICRDWRRFLELVATVRENDSDEEDVDRINGDFAFDLADRATEDAVTARSLVRVAETMDPDDWWRTPALRFAAQLFGPGDEDALANVMAVGNEYTREVVRRRWQGLGTTAARDHLRKDDAAFRSFLRELRQAMEAAGLQTEKGGRGEEFRLQPGNIGLNFVMMFAQCRRPGAMAEIVQRFVDRQQERQRKK